MNAPHLETYSAGVTTAASWTDPDVLPTWLAATGTIAAVVISLGVVLRDHFAQRRERRESQEFDRKLEEERLLALAHGVTGRARVHVQRGDYNRCVRVFVFNHGYNMVFNVHAHFDADAEDAWVPVGNVPAHEERDEWSKHRNTTAQLPSGQPGRMPDVPVEIVFMTAAEQWFQRNSDGTLNRLLQPCHVAGEPRSTDPSNS